MESGNSVPLFGPMPSTRRISFTDLSPKARQLLKTVQQGDTILLEEEGEDEAVIVDITDYRLLRAAMHAVAQRPGIEPKAGLSEEALSPKSNRQTRYDQILSHYLAGSISLSRAAELLELSPPELRARFERLGLPQRTAPSDVEEARRDTETVLDWSADNGS